MKTYFLDSVLDRVSDRTDLNNFEGSLKKILSNYDEYSIERGVCSDPVMSFSGHLRINRKFQIVGVVYSPQYGVIAGEKVSDATFELVRFEKPKQRLIKRFWYFKKADSKQDVVGGDYSGFASIVRLDKIVFADFNPLKFFLRMKK